jgi:hypothetical protein
MEAISPPPISINHPSKSTTSIRDSFLTHRLILQPLPVLGFGLKAADDQLQGLHLLADLGRQKQNSQSLKVRKLWLTLLLFHEEKILIKKYVEKVLIFKNIFSEFSYKVERTCDANFS